MELENIHELNEIVEDDGDRIVFKIALVGDSGVGKTNLLNRLVTKDFLKESKATVGVELQSKTYKIDDRIVKLQIWDTAGQERFQSLTSSYFKGAKGGMIVYDITKNETYNNAINHWVECIKQNGDPEICIILIGNKSDLELNREVKISSAKDKAKELGTQYKFLYLGIMFMETSAENSSNVDIAFKTMLKSKIV